MMTLIAWLVAAPAAAQDLELPAASPRATVSQHVGVVEIEVDYSSPGKKDRTVWGELVPYGTMWRTGANAATTLETDGAIKVGGVDVPAGKYSVFTIPGETEWTVILNKNPAASTGSYDQAQDAARVTVKPTAGGERERLTFLFADTDDDSTQLDLEWAGVRVGVPIEVATGALVEANIASYTKSASRGLVSAARYELDHGNLDEALKLVDASLAIDKTWLNTFVKADALHQKGENKAAYKLAQEALALGTGQEGFFWKDRVEKAVAEWPKK